MRTSLQLLAVVLVLAGCSAVRHPAMPGTSTATPLPSISGINTSRTAVRPVTQPLAGVRAHHINQPRTVNLSQFMTERTALTLSAGSGPRRDAPEMRLTFALQYLF